MELLAKDYGLLLLAAAASPAMAQDSGGLELSPEALAVGGPQGLARPMRVTFPSIGAADLQSTPTPAGRQQRHQAMIARTRGDGGYLESFALGQPRAASRCRRWSSRPSCRSSSTSAPGW